MYTICSGKRRGLIVWQTAALPEVAGWALLRLGWDQERRGLRAAAVDYYHKAADLKRFSFRAAARDRERYPAGSEPEG